ncbi:hypothetical protein LguiB_015311 [Lonicera macranthoides]
MRIKQRFFEHLSVLIMLFLSLLYTKLVLGVTSRVDDATELKCIESDKRALLKFKQGLVDDYGRLSSWGTSQEEDCCKWRGIKCSNRTGHITVLDLHGRFKTSNGDDYQSLSGKVSPSLLDLKHLNYLDLSSNDFGLSPIPEFIGSLSKLQHLNLADSNVVGPIPHQLGNLTNLRSLDLGGNPGLTVKNLEWLSHLRLLSYLDLSWVDLENTNWLQPISKLYFLTELHLGFCNLPGNLSLSLPLTNSSSLAVIDLSENLFDSSSSYNWLVNLSSGGSLVELNMYGNRLRGSVPETLGNLVSLEKLDLSFCELRGEIPKSFRNLIHLRSFELYYSEISGKLPEFFQTLALDAEKSLEYLGLEGNQFSGSLPDFTRFSSLRELRLADNELNGSFPESFGKISSLVFLDLSRNQMTGPLPDLAFLPSLRELYLTSNKLNGTIPKSLGQLSKLEILDVLSNSFEGTISEAHLSNLSKLNTLDLSFNSLTLDVSSNWTPPFQLEIIRLAFCKLGTHFPNWLQSQKNFSILDISGAGISDTVPSWFWDLPTRLAYLNISNNQINGLVPNLTSKVLVDFQTLDLSSNRFLGPIASLPPTVRSINLSKNMLTGSVSFLCTTVKELPTFVDLSDNLLSGKFPDCWTESQALVFLNLANNNLSGEIPSSIGLLTQLLALQLRNNSFVGELPLSLKNCTELMVIDLGLNKLSGKVPAWIGMHLKDLLVLSFRRNEFYGSIPPEICQLNRTQILDLSQNYISGNIPLCFNKLISLVQRDSSEEKYLNFIAYTRNGLDHPGQFLANALVQWKGKEAEYEKTLTLLKCIDLSSNKLVGNIPPEFSSLEELISLNLSRNNLSGNIIQQIGQMRMLESIDFSRNHLSGQIPTGLSNLTFLSVLDLSNNNLSGKIPPSTQLQSFDASMYAGNPELCGLPLLNKCPGDEAALVSPSIDHGVDNNNQEDEDTFKTTGFYISVTLGFSLGFWVFCGPLLLQSSWRYAYFNKLDKVTDWIYVTAKAKKTGLQRKIRR